MAVMAWAWAYLSVSIVGAAFVVNAYRPIRVPPLSGLSFFAGWPTAELAPWHMAWQALATAGFAAAGAFGSWPGWAGLAITGVAWVGLVGLVLESLEARGVLDRALAEGGIEAPPASGRHTMWRLPRLLYPLPRPARSMRVTRHVDYAGDGARHHRLDVMVRRRDPPQEAAPVLLYIHGGAWVFGDKREQGLPMLEELARRGWVTVSINYGLGPRTRWPGQVADCTQALSWVREHIAEHGGDPGFVVVSGGSAGGHLAALVALTAKESPVAACVPFYGVYDFTGSGEDHRSEEALRILLETRVFPRPRREDPECYRQASPLFQVHAEAPPFFVLHGTRDTLVPVSEARRFVSALREVAGTAVIYAELPGAQHAFDVLPSVRCALAVDAVASFLEAVRRGGRAVTGLSL